MGLARRTACVVILTAWGCTKVTSSGNLSGPLPPPEHIIVGDFESSPEEVKLDRGLLPKTKRALSSRSVGEREQEVGRQLAAVVSKSMVDELTESGFKVQRGGDAPDGSLVVLGQFLTVDEGNQTGRMVVGLGMGKSDVKAAMQVYQVQGGRLILAEQFVGDSHSGFKPGMAETLTAGVAGAAASATQAAATSGATAIGGEAFLGGIKADGERMGKELARQIEGMYVARGWAK
jgi:hypothetical protein